MIVGLTGKNGAGKGLVARYLQNLGYEYHSLSDVIRDELKKEQKEVSRANLILKGTELREKGGAGVLAEIILKKIPHTSHCVVDSIRNPAEVLSLRQRPDFILLAITAPQALRFERCVARGRKGDPLNFEEFVRLENLELENENPSAQKLLETLALADAEIENGLNPEVCYKAVDGVLKDYKPRETL